VTVRGDPDLLESKADLAEQHFRELDAIQAEGVEASGSRCEVTSLRTSR
jgi:hypothetical protein